MKKEDTPIPVTLPKLIEIGKNVLKIARENIELVKFGIGAKYLAEFEGELTDVQTYKTDKQIKKEAAALTETKNKKLKECFNWMKRAKTFYEKIVKPDSADAKIFPQNLAAAKSSEAIMINIMPIAIDIIVKNKTALVDKEMPETFDTEGSALLTELDDLNNQQEDMKKNNESYTVKRYIAQSKVYNRVNAVNNAGRQAYAEDSVKIHLFDSPWGTNGSNNEDPQQDKPSTPPQA